MKRRTFLAASASTLIAPLARAQGQPPIVGFINDSGSNSGPSMIGFLRGLSRAGFITNQNVLVTYQQADRYDEAPALALNLVRRGASVIVALNTPNMALAAKDATKTIPIVFAVGADPVRCGLVESLEKPGGNITGVTFTTPAVFARWAELLQQIAKPGATLGILTNPANRGSEFNRADLAAAVTSRGGKLAVYEANSDSEIDAAFANASADGVGALAVDNDSRLSRMRAKIIAAAASRKLATLYPGRDWIADGGLIGYGGVRGEQERQLGEYVGRVLKGEKPAALPVVAPAKFELGLNLKTAAALGLEIPASIRSAASETIE